MQINWCILLWVGFCHSHRHPIFPCLLDILQLVRHWVSLCCLLFGYIMSVACGTPEIHQFPTARLITAVNCLYHRTALYFYYLALGIIISSVFLVCCPYYMLRAGHQLSSLINSACAELVYQTIMWAGAFKSPLSSFTISALSSDHLFFFFFAYLCYTSCTCPQLWVPPCDTVPGPLTKYNQFVSIELLCSCCTWLWWSLSSASFPSRHSLSPQLVKSLALNHDFYILEFLCIRF